MSLLPIARHRRAHQAVLVGSAGAVDAALFFAQAARLARALPQGTHVINLCETRHGFMLGFAAALLRGQVSLLPPGRGRGDWETLLHRYGGAYVLSDSPVGSAHLSEHTSTPRHDFLRMCTLWLLVLRMAHPEECRLASSLLGGYTWRQWPSAHSEYSS